MAELADAGDLKSPVRKDVWVQLPPAPPGDLVAALTLTPSCDFPETSLSVKSAAGTIKARSLHLAMRSEYEQPARWRNHCNYHGNDAREGSYLNRYEGTS